MRNPEPDSMDLLDRIHRDRIVRDADGHEYRLHSETSAAQCAFIAELMNEIGASRSLEVGLAYGISALAICRELKNREGPVHYVIDPMQEYWKNIGTHNLRLAGYWDFVRFIPQYSDVALSRLFLEGITIDFAYIDSTKIFDILLVDTHFIHKMLSIGGLLVLDDVGCPGIRKLVRMLVQMPQWELHALYGLSPLSRRRALVAELVSFMPRREELVSPDLADGSRERRINAQAIAFRKVSEDTRNWDWSCRF